MKTSKIIKKQTPPKRKVPLPKAYRLNSKSGEVEYPLAPMDPALSPGEHLDKYGYVVLPLLDDPAEILGRVKKELSESPYIAPEMREQFMKQPAKTAFGRIAVPDSFHLPAVRELRRIARDTILKKLPGYAQSLYTALAFDGLCCRPVGSSNGKETLHYDRHPEGESIEVSEILGGWISLQSDQTLTCIPGTHAVHHTRTGFVRMDNLDERRHELRRVKVPEGHMLLFCQQMLHVLPKFSIKHKDHWRLFMSVFFTIREKITCEFVQEACQTGAVPFLPSGQRPGLYEDMNLASESNVKNLAEWCKIFAKEIPRNDKGIVPRVLGPPEQYGIGHPYVYDEKDLEVLTATFNV